MSGQLSPLRARTILALDVEAITTALSRIIQPVLAVAILTMPTLSMVSGSLYLCKTEPWMLELEHI